MSKRRISQGLVARRSPNRRVRGGRERADSETPNSSGPLCHHPLATALMSQRPRVSRAVLPANFSDRFVWHGFDFTRDFAGQSKAFIGEMVRQGRPIKESLAADVSWRTFLRR